MKKHLSFINRAYLIFFMILLLPLGSTYLAVRDSISLRKDVEQLTTNFFPILEITNNLAINLDDIQKMYLNACFDADEEALDEATAIYKQLKEDFTNLSLLSKNPLIDDLFKQLVQYCDQSTRIAQSIINGGELSEVSDIQELSVIATSLSEGMSNYRRQKSQQVSLSITHIQQISRPIYLIVGISSVISLIVIIGIAFYARELAVAHENLKQTQRKLIQTEKMASLGQLVAGVAHEINNPVNFIKSNIQPLKDYLFGYKKLVDAMGQEKDIMPASLKTKYETIFEEEDLEFANEDSEKLINSFEIGSDRVTRIVSDLRLYSRGDEGYFSPFDIHEAIDSSLTLLYNRYKNRITIHKDYSNLPSVICSPGKISQVFLNLLSNALDAIDNEGNVWITTKQAENHVFVNIKDDGMGISPEVQSKIFDPFFTTKPVGSGTGLGLSLSYGIIEQHGGIISVESELEKGTTFTVKIPIDKNQE